MSVYLVEDKPITKPTANRLTRRYPFHEMKIGKSFAVSRDDADRVRAAAYAHAKKHGVRFAFVKDGEAFRCGRTA